MIRELIQEANETGYIVFRDEGKNSRAIGYENGEDIDWGVGTFKSFEKRLVSDELWKQFVWEKKYADEVASEWGQGYKVIKVSRK